MFGIKTPLDKVQQQVGGLVNNARDILEYNPSLSGLVLPPQVTMGLAVANKVGGMLGVKIPTESELKQFAQGKIDNILGGLRKPILEQLNKLEGDLKAIGDKLGSLSPEDAIKSIDWLR